MTRPRTSMVLAAVMSILAATSCDGLSFVEDRRLTFVSPEDRSTVRLPVTIDWDIDGFVVTGPGEVVGPDARDEGYFGVFVDRSPQPPGEPLDWFARDDTACLADPGCPDEDWYANRGVHVTTETSFSIAALAPPTDDARDDHTVTVVLLDPEGHRIGESAWDLDFSVDRSPTG